MEKLVIKIKEIFFERNFILFVLIGLLNTFNGVWISYLLSLWLQPNFAFIVGYICSLGIAYILNSIFNFKEKISLKKFVKFAISYIPNFIIQNITVFIVFNILNWHRMFAYAAAAVIGIPITYICLKFFAFKDKKGKDLNQSKGFINWFNTHPILANVSVFCFMLFIASIANWSLLLGENLMKWDIWQAEYPNQVLMSDALSNLTIPLWNPLMQYGSPNYAILGTPIWYPITLLLAAVGYTPRILAISYVLHIAIGGYGMYLLGLDEIREEGMWISPEILGTAIVLGVLYCGNGVFLSNAQHIMIIISAAWIPFVFYFARKYILNEHFIYALATGLCAGMIILGGYPELFYDTFLFLAVFVLYFDYDSKQGVIYNIGHALIKYITICVNTICASAVSVLPFVMNVGLITRSEGGQIPGSYSMSTVLSALFTKTTQIIDNVEWSMVNYYFGIIVILIIPLIIKKLVNTKETKLKVYAGLVAVAFFMCQGRNSFLHSIIYRFFPMYASFRFPALNRSFIIIFILLLSASSFKEIFKGEVDIKELAFIKGLLISTIVLAVGCSFIAEFSLDILGIDLEKCIIFSQSAFTTAGIIALYSILFLIIDKKSLKLNIIRIILVIFICIEVLVYYHEEGPITISAYNATEYSYDTKVRDVIDQEFEDVKNRNREVSFVGNKRSTSGLNSKKIVFNKTFDEEGYISFILQATADFKTTYMRSIIEGNPIVYFTNDVISGKNVDYLEWVTSCENRPEQIYVKDAKNISKAAPIQSLSGEILEEKEIVIERLDDITISLSGILNSGSTKTSKIRVYLKERLPDEKINLKLIFTDESGTEYTHCGDFVIFTEGNKSFVEIYFPDVNKTYNNIKLTSESAVLNKAKLVVMDKLVEDQFVNVTTFGFNTIVMEVEVPTDGYVTLLQAKHNGWKAYVDDKEVAIDSVNECFMGVYLEKGKHIVTMKFRPTEFFLGAIITFIYYLLVMVIGVRLIYCKCINNCGSEVT